MRLIDKVTRIIECATGERFGDGSIVMDVCVGFAEPGYGDDDSIVVIGNWNPPRFPRNGDAPLTKDENLPVRLGNALEWLGAECVWSDEWTRCDECYRAIRTNADSYCWTMYGAFIECGYVCTDCLRKDIGAYLDEYLNNADTAIVWAEPSDLESLGFARWAPDDPQTYESGWHPGQDDDPHRILASILDEVPNGEVVFLIDSVGQFDMRFSAFVRTDDSQGG